MLAFAARVVLAALLLAGTAQAADDDGDGAPNEFDNCVLEANGPSLPDPGGNSQLDVDQDGFGNLCDADFDNSGLVSQPDYIAFLAGYGKSEGDPGYDPATDLDGDGVTGIPDFSRFLDAYEDPPGPSGYTCAGTVPCPMPPELTLAAPIDGSVLTSSSVAVSGSILPADTPVTVNGMPAVVAGTSFSLSDLPLALGTNQILASATHDGLVGEASSLVVRVANAPPPAPPEPDPGAVNPYEATSLFAATGFLYSGPEAVQTGLDPAAIAPDRVAAIRGHVVLRNGSPLPSVRVSVHGRPEFGETLTRDGGAFDLVVGVGGALTLVFEREGFLPVHRKVDLQWQDHRAIEDVVMIPFDWKANVVDPGAGADYVVARGSEVE